MEIINFISIIIVIMIMAVVIKVLIEMNKKIREKIEIKRNKYLSYRRCFEEIRILNPNEKELEKLNKLARDFFKEVYKLKYNLSYSELSEKFKSKNINEKRKYIKFCNTMSDIFYSGRKIKSVTIKKAINIFSEILDSANFIKI